MVNFLTVNTCGCCSLETATRIIGYIYSVTYGLAFVGFYCYTLAQELEESGRHVLYYLLAVTAEQSSLFFSCIFGIYLIRGVQKQMPEYILSWILLCISTIISTTAAIIFQTYPTHLRLGSVFRLVELIIIDFAECGMLFIVCNYYKQISRGNLSMVENADQE